MRDVYPQIQAARAELVAIGSGTPEQASELATKLNVPFRILSDPQRKSYKAAGMRKDFFSSLNPLAATNMFRSFRKGFRQGKLQGDAFQQGGALAIGTEGNVLFEYISSAGGDHFDPKDLIEALSAD